MLRAASVPVAPVGRALETARAALEKAERPLIVAGLDAMEQGAGSALVMAAERIGAHVITSYKAKGMIDEAHPLALGGAGLSPKADKLIMPVIAQADVILCVGYDPVEMRTGWQNPWDPKTQTVIDITAEPNHHYMHQSTINILGHCAASLEAMMPTRTPADWAEAKALREDLRQAFAAPETWGPGQIVETCQRTLPESALATCDSGAHRILLSQMWKSHFPRALTQSTGLCTMGCAMPLALGAQIVDPERTVVGFMGDAGFLMTTGELATAAERGLKTIFVVFVDSSLALIELKQRQRQLKNAGVDFGLHDYAGIARAFGGAGATVTSKEELEEALKAALVSETFTVIAAQFDRKAYDGTF